MTELLTDAEHRAMALTVELVNLLAGEIVGEGRGRVGDINELVRDIHRIQRAIMAQAAARAYPDRYRLLGCEVGQSEVRTGPKPPADTSWLRTTDN